MEDHLSAYDGCKTPPADDSEAEAAAKQESEQSDNSEAGAQSDSEHGSEHDSDDDGKGDGDRSKRRFAQRGRRTWTELANFDRTARLARKKCKNPFDGVARNQASRPEEDHRVRNEEHWKQRDITHVATYYCPLRNRCGCRAQLRITRAPSVAVLEWSGGPLTYKLCHSEDA